MLNFTIYDITDIPNNKKRINTSRTYLSQTTTIENRGIMNFCFVLVCDSSVVEIQDSENSLRALNV